MPRVNRDLQRRMAARRERERRRPTERRYNFTPAESEVIDENGSDAGTFEDVADAEVATSAPAERAPASARGTQTSASTTARATNARPTPPPFSAYKDEYAYVYRDLRRVAAVIGGLLLALIVLYFVLPLLVH